MRSIRAPKTDCKPQLFDLAIDGKITDSLKFLPMNGGWVGILERIQWEIVEQPEPSISYYVITIYDAIRLGASFCSVIDESNGIGYITPICRFPEQGIKQGFGERQKVLLPLRYWDVFHDSKGFTSTQTAQSAENV